MPGAHTACVWMLPVWMPSDLLKASPDRAPWRPRVGIAPKISDAELITLAVMQALLGHTSEARWLRYTRSHLQHLFRYLPKQSGYNKRLRRLGATIGWLVGVLARDTTLWTDDVWVADSTPVECARSREAVQRSDRSAQVVRVEVAAVQRIVDAADEHLGLELLAQHIPKRRACCLRDVAEHERMPRSVVTHATAPSGS